MIPALRVLFILLTSLWGLIYFVLHYPLEMEGPF